MCVCIFVVSLCARCVRFDPPPTKPPSSTLNMYKCIQTYSKPRAWTAKSALGLAAKMYSRGSDYGAATAEVYVDEQMYEVQVR